MRAVEKRDEGIAKLHTDPVALTGQAISQMKGCDRAQMSWFSPLEAKREQEEATRFFDPETAELLMALLKENKLPAWTAEVTNFEMVQKAAGRNPDAEA